MMDMITKMMLILYIMRQKSDTILFVSFLIIKIKIKPITIMIVMLIMNIIKVLTMLIKRDDYGINGGYNHYDKNKIKTMMLMLNIMMHKKYDIYISFILFQDGYSAVHLAAMYSREDTIRHLVHKKGDINAIGGVGDVISLSRVSRKFGFRFRRRMINHLFIYFLIHSFFCRCSFFFISYRRGVRLSYFQRSRYMFYVFFSFYHYHCCVIMLVFFQA